MELINLGEILYKDALDIQIDFVEKVRTGESGEVILICSHPPVVTLGRKTRPSDLIDWKGAVYEVSRGGRATYHGPGQVVVYPILNLEKRGHDIYKYLRLLEKSIVKTLKDLGVDAIGDPDSTGVWCNGKKMASIGVALKRWVTYHGLAFNLESDPMAFQGINPCGMGHSTMISLENLLGEKIERSFFEKKLEQNLLNLLSVENFNLDINKTHS